MGILFSAIVFLISARVFVFSSFYIRGELFIKRFILLVVLFVMSMSFFIFIPHIIGILLGWDGLGLVSFYLVIYYQNPKSLAGGILTVLRNRIGDALILLVIFLSIEQGHWLITNLFHFEYRGVLAILVLFAAITKRAQIPFSRWLPAAIAAPTPVSALVHSSTLVTAGVFLLIRFYDGLKEIRSFFSVLIMVSSLTIVIAGIAAVVENDIKKIIALSTLRQLGLIMFRLSIGLPFLAFFHLLTHAIFKALLFMAAGALIFIFSHVQDLRFLGNLSIQVPVVCAAILAANLALGGFPFMAGYYSKDLILEHLLESRVSRVLSLIGLGGTVLTGIYRIRLILLVIWKPQEEVYYKEPIEVDYLLIPLRIMTFLAVVGGAMLNWVLLFDIFPPIVGYIKVLPLYLVFLGSCVSWRTYMTWYGISWYFKNKILFNAIRRIWFLTPLSTQPFVYVGKELRGLSYFLLDQGWLEIVGPQGIIKLRREWFKIFQPWRRKSVCRFLLIGLILLCFLLW